MALNTNPFTLLKTAPECAARLGQVATDHGVITTPIFMPVGTAASVKAIPPRDLLDDIQAQIILANTYHLYLRPGTALIAEAGGVHKFMGFPRPMLTDSGGFQVWSLKELRKLKEEGVEFRSHLDGSKHLFSPASVMKAQREIGADIIMAFDECTPYPATQKEAQFSLNLTRRWTEQAMKWLSENPPVHPWRQFFFGIAQGSMFPELRKQAIEHLTELEVDGFALGGLSVGEPTELMYDVAEASAQWLPRDRARYVMGVGTPWNLLELIARGIDMFDCVMPSRNARNGMVFTSQGVLHYKAGRFAHQINTPLDSNCTCYTCRNFSRAYMRHLHNAGELLVMQLATLHNLHFYVNLMAEARAAIAADRYLSWAREKIPVLQHRIEE